MLDITTITYAITKRNRVVIQYNGKLYKRTELYCYGYNSCGKAYIRLYDCEAMRWKLFLCEKIEQLQLVPNSIFSIIRTGYSPFSDKEITKIITKV